MDLQEINKTINVLKQYCDLPKFKNMTFDDRELQLSQIFGKFKEKYPTVFKVIIRGENLDNLDMFLTILKQIEDGAVDQKRAEIMLGEKLAKQYIYPVIGENGIDIEKKQKDLKKFLNKKT